MQPLHLVLGLRRARFQLVWPAGYAPQIFMEHSYHMTEARTSLIREVDRNLRFFDFHSCETW